MLVVILGGGRGTRLHPLTSLRSKPAVPLAGKYRLIDVPISNALNSGMGQIFVLTQFNSVSLHRHIGSTYRAGDLSGGFVEILAAQQTPAGERWFQGTADAVRQTLPYLSELLPELILILSGDHLYRMDYNLMVREHMRARADITVAVLPSSESEIGDLGAVRLDDHGRLLEFREKPRTAATRAGMAAPAAWLAAHHVPAERCYLASMGVYLFRREVLEACLQGDDPDFGKDVLPAAVRERRVHAHVFAGYWRDIGTVRSFYDVHMDMLAPDPPFDLGDPRWPIYTHPRSLPPTRIDRVQCTASIVAEGADISNTTLDHSIIGVRAVIHGAQLRRTLLMGADPHYPEAPGGPPVGVGEGTMISSAIVDKNARIGRGVCIAGGAGIPDAEGAGWAVRDGVVVVAKNAVVPDGTRIPLP